MMHEETHQIQTIEFIYLLTNNVTKIYIVTHQQRHQNLYNYSPTTSPEFI